MSAAITAAEKGMLRYEDQQQVSLWLRHYKKCLKKVSKQKYKMNFRELDDFCTWNFKEDKLKRAQLLGFDYISEAMVKLYQQFKSLRIVAYLLGCTPVFLVNRFRQWGVPTYSPGGPNNTRAYINPDKLRKLGLARDEGWSYRVIADRLGYSNISTVYNHYQRYLREKKGNRL